MDAPHSTSAPTSAVRRDIAVVYATALGHGGSGLLAQQVVSGLSASGARLHALGPPRRDKGDSRSIVWHDPAPGVPGWRRRYTPLRWNTGELVLRESRIRGQWAATRLQGTNPALCYAFAEVGLEPLQWAKRHGVPTVLDSPSGNIRHFHDVLTREYALWCHTRARQHPTGKMVERVEEEYRLADRIRAASNFTRDSMVANGVQPEKISVVPYQLDVSRFQPPAGGRPDTSGPLRVCYVGMLAMHKGFAYLLRAARLLGPSAMSLRLIGGTVDRPTHRLLREERRGLPVTGGPADDLVAELHRAELLVLPSLHDGFGFVAAEAMATGLPVVVTDQTGAADWVSHGETGWIIPAANVDALAAVLQLAIDRRATLPDMGRQARAAVSAASASEAQFQRWATGGFVAEGGDGA